MPYICNLPNFYHIEVVSGDVKRVMTPSYLGATWDICRVEVTPCLCLYVQVTKPMAGTALLLVWRTGMLACLCIQGSVVRARHKVIVCCIRSHWWQGESLVVTVSIIEKVFCLFWLLSALSLEAWWSRFNAYYFEPTSHCTKFVTRSLQYTTQYIPQY